MDSDEPDRHRPRSGRRRSGPAPRAAGPPVADAQAGGAVTGTKRAILERLKRVEHATASELAAEVGVSEAGVRQHLDELARQGFVAGDTTVSAASSAATPAGATRGRGRPATPWRLTEAARHQFADRHADLSVHLVDAIRTALGEEALDRVISARTLDQRSTYATRVPDQGPVRERVEALARVRSEEGYMAEAVITDDALLLVEHHCPICDAATSCQGLCREELSLFRSVLGDDVHVERTQHLLSGDTRCVYEIT